MKIICLLIMIQTATLALIAQTPQQIPQQKQKTNADQYSVKLIPTDAGTYGYEIYSNNKLLIRQVNIPGYPGNKGFKRKADAQKVAKLVIQKLSKGIMPPTVEKKEMDKLHVQF